MLLSSPYLDMFIYTKCPILNFLRHVLLSSREEQRTFIVSFLNIFIDDVKLGRSVNTYALRHFILKGICRMHFRINAMTSTLTE